VFENKAVLSNTLWPKRDEVRGECAKLPKEELLSVCLTNSYSGDQINDNAVG